MADTAPATREVDTSMADTAPVTEQVHASVADTAPMTKEVDTSEDRGLFLSEREPLREVESKDWRKLLGKLISIAIIATAVVLGLVVLYHSNFYPRTEDAEVFANFIGIAPQVDGPLVRLNVKDNQFVKKGDLLYEIDERPYQYAFEDRKSVV